jgi:hypothetical protein
VAHARGVSAILISQYSVYDLFCGVQLFRLPSPLSITDLEISEPGEVSTATPHSAETYGILPMPSANSPWATLDPMFVKTVSLKRKAEKLLDDVTEAISIDDVQILKLEAELLRTDYQKCVMHLSKEWTSSLIGTITSSYKSTK